MVKIVYNLNWMKIIGSVAWAAKLQQVSFKNNFFVVRGSNNVHFLEKVNIEFRPITHFSIRVKVKHKKLVLQGFLTYKTLFCLQIQPSRFLGANLKYYVNTIGRLLILLDLIIKY